MVYSEGNNLKEIFTVIGIEDFKIVQNYMYAWGLTLNLNQSQSCTEICLPASPLKVAKSSCTASDKSKLVPLKKDN